LAKSQTPDRARQRDEARQVIGSATAIASAGREHPSPVAAQAVAAVVRFVEAQPKHPTSQQLRRALSAVAAVPIGAVIMLSSWALQKLRKRSTVFLAPQAAPVEVVYASDEAPQAVEPAGQPVLTEDPCQDMAEDDASDLDPAAIRGTDPDLPAEDQPTR
jgi:hypothetical protein